MKKLLLCAALFISSFTFAQKAVDSVKDTTASATPILDKTEKLVDKYGGKIADAFMSTMEKAKPMAKEGFESVVWLQIAKGVAGVLPLILCIIFMIIFVKEYRKIDNLLKSENVPKNMDNHYGPFDSCNINPILTGSFILTGIMVIVTVFTIADGIQHLIAPKWFAIKEIIDLIK